jgi:fibronectin-binding autotransporter adhesin
MRIVAVLSVGLVFGFLASTGRSSGLYWSGNGSAVGGTGTWDSASTTNWGAVVGGPFSTPWSNANNDTAIFGGTKGKVTLGSGITVGGLQFNTTDYLITNAASTLTFGATDNAITLNGIAAATIAGVVASSGNVSLTAASPNTAGTVTFTGATGSGWSGGTTVNPGMTLLVGQAGTLLADTSDININGGTLRLERANDSIAGTQVSDTAPITFNGGGTLIFRQNTAILNKAENVGAVTIASGQANFDLTNGTSTGGNTNVLSSLTRSVDTATFTFSSATTNLTWRVSDQADTVAGRIIGPWATHGTATPGAGAQTDYAIYAGGNGSVVGANIAASTQDTWTDSAKQYTVTNGATLGGTLTITALRGIGVAQAVDLGGNNLETYGLLNGGTGALTITNGILTTPVGLAGTTNNLFITPGSGAITNYSAIADNVASVKLVKSGGSTLTLSANNTYSGSTLINAGTLAISTNSNLGADGTAITFSGSATLNQVVNIDLGSRPIVLSTGAVATLGSQSATAVNLSIAGAVTGDGSLIWHIYGTGGGSILTLSSASNTFTGVLALKPGSGGYVGNIVFSSIGDAPGAGPIIFNGAEGTAGSISYNGTAPLTLNHRQLALDTGTSLNAIRSFKNNSANAVVTINTDLLIYGPSLNRGLSFGGTSTLLNIFSGIMADFSGGTFTFQKLDAGTWYLSNTNNSYTGPTTITAGILAVSKLANGGMNSPIGASSSASNNLVLNGGALRYIGPGDSTDRGFNLSANSSLDASGTGALSFTSTATPGYGTVNVARTLTLTGSSTNDNAIVAAFTNNGTGLFSLSKTGIGKWVLTGTNTSTGTSSLSGGGTLVLDYTGGDSSRLPSGTITLGGGTLELRGGGQTQVAGAAALNAGGSFIVRDAGASRLRMNAIARFAGSTFDFADGSIADTDSNNFGTSGTNGILGGWATVGSHWACSANTGAADTTITALSSYTAFVTSGGSSTANYQLTGGSALGGALAAGSIRISNDGNGQILALGDFNLTITSTSQTVLGGMLYAGGGDNNYTISGGTGRIITSTASQELIFNVSTGTLSVGAFVAASGSTGPVTKSGPGRLEIASSNNYTGALRVNQGIVRLAHDNAAGTTAGGITVQNGAALELTNSVNIGAEALTITGTGIANGGALLNVAGNTSTYAGAITIGAGGTRINSDAGGNLTLSSNLVTAVFQDATIGGSGNTTVSGVISGAGNLIKDGSGTLTLAGTNTFTGDVVVDGGKLLISSTAGAIGDGSTLRINSGKLELSSGVTETVGTLYLGGQPVTPGTWGRTSSGATYQDDTYFVGSGSVSVQSAGAGTPYTAVKGAAGTLIIIK